MSAIRTQYNTRNESAHKVIVAVLVTLMLVALCGCVLVFSWPANMEADYEGFGLLGAFVPVFGILGAFCMGLGAAQAFRE